MGNQHNQQKKGGACAPCILPLPITHYFSRFGFAVPHHPSPITHDDFALAVPHHWVLIAHNRFADY